MFVAAIISMCLVSGPCQTINAKVEPKACNSPSYRGQIVRDGGWKDIIIRIQCKS